MATHRGLRIKWYITCVIFSAEVVESRVQFTVALSLSDQWLLTYHHFGNLCRHSSLNKLRRHNRVLLLLSSSHNVSWVVQVLHCSCICRCCFCWLLINLLLSLTTTAYGQSWLGLGEGLRGRSQSWWRLRRRPQSWQRWSTYGCRHSQLVLLRHDISGWLLQRVIWWWLCNHRCCRRWWAGRLVYIICIIRLLSRLRNGSAKSNRHLVKCGSIRQTLLSLHPTSLWLCSWLVLRSNPCLKCQLDVILTYNLVKVINSSCLFIFDLDPLFTHFDNFPVYLK